MTLTELTIIGVLATIVMLALTGFYFNSQRMWMDSSVKAMGQRDATLLVEALRSRVHEARTAIVDTSDPLHHSLTLEYKDAPTVLFHWNTEDSLVHIDEAGTDLGAVGESHVTKFLLTTVGTNLVELTLLERVTSNGDTVHVGSTFQLLGGD